MKEIKSTDYNITGPLIGRVQTKLPLWPQRHIIFKSESFNWRSRYCAASIYPINCKSTIKSNLPFMRIQERDYISLRDDDVIAISTNGSIQVLYDAAADDNAILTTTKCNCRCVMCPQSLHCNEVDDPTQVNTILRMIDLISCTKCKHLGITGGEPTLLGDGLIKIIRQCRDKLPNTSVSLLTNGILLKNLDLTKALAVNAPDDFVVCIPIYADVDELHDAIIQHKGGFYCTMKGLHNLALCRQKVEIRNVITAMTYERLSNYADFIYRNYPFVVHVALMGMEIIEDAKLNYDKLWVEGADLVKPLSTAVNEFVRRNVNVSIYNFPLCVLPKELWPFCRKSISIWKREYFDLCNNCSARTMCGGVFKSNVPYYQHAIKPL